MASPQDTRTAPDTPHTDPVVADFEVTDWRQAEEGGRQRAFVTKTFSGALTGTSEAEVLMAGDEAGRGYIANEVFIGTINGRQGTIVFQHGGIDDGVAPFTYGYVVPGTGTDELAGLTGQITYSHDESGARVQLILNS
jgi:hypothetical protein